jgi:integrase/recombinase XerC
MQALTVLRDVESKENLFKMLLADKRSENTRRAYESDLADFFLTVFNKPVTPSTIGQFLSMDRGQMTFAALDYKARLLEKGLAEATVNRRISAIKSLVNFAYRTGQISFKLDIQGEKVKAYRDTRGTDTAGVKRLLLQPDRTTMKGKRDFAILYLLWENALRRAEVTKLDISDFKPEENRLFILGKGRGKQKEAITLSDKATEAINDYLQARPQASPQEPLFLNCDRARKGDGRLTGDAVYYLVKYYSLRAGFNKPLAPHKIRHSAITAALDATGGNVRMVQKLSRHAKIETLMLYDDNRADLQGEVTRLLSAMV